MEKRRREEGRGGESRGGEGKEQDGSGEERRKKERKKEERREEGEGRGEKEWRGNGEIAKGEGEEERGEERRREIGGEGKGSNGLAKRRDRLCLKGSLVSFPDLGTGDCSLRIGIEGILFTFFRRDLSLLEDSPGRQKLSLCFHPHLQGLYMTGAPLRLCVLTRLNWHSCYCKASSQ